MKIISKIYGIGCLMNSPIVKAYTTSVQPITRLADHSFCLHLLG